MAGCSTWGSVEVERRGFWVLGFGFRGFRGFRVSGGGGCFGGGVFREGRVREVVSGWGVQVFGVTDIFEGQKGVTREKAQKWPKFWVGVKFQLGVWVFGCLGLYLLRFSAKSSTEKGATIPKQGPKGYRKRV